MKGLKKKKKRCLYTVKKKKIINWHGQRREGLVVIIIKWSRKNTRFRTKLKKKLCR